MYIYLTLFALISILLISFCNNIILNKNSNFKTIHLSLGTLLFIGLSQIISSIYIQTSVNVSFTIFKILNMITIFGSNVSLIVYLFFRIYSEKVSLNKENIFFAIKQSLHQNFILLSSLILFIIISIFVTNDFTDTGLYLKLSQQFKYSILPNLNEEYRYATSYYVYSAISSSYTVPIYFNYLTPFIFIVILNASINDFILDKFKANKIYIQILFLIISTLMSIFYIPTTSSGNLYIQASILFFIILALVGNKIETIPFFLLLSQFFSITGFFLSLIIIVSLFIYMILFSKIKDYYKWIIYLSISAFCLGPVIPLSISRLSNYVPTFSIIFIVISCIVIALGLIMYKLSIYHQDKLDTRLSICNKLLAEKRIILNISISSLIGLFTLITIIYFACFYKSNIYFSVPMLSIFGVTFSLLLIWSIFKNKDSSVNFMYFVGFNIIVVGILSIFLWITNLSNASIWRINYVSCTFPTPQAIITILLLSYLLIGILLNNSRLLAYLQSKINLNHKFIKPITWICVFILSFIPILYSQVTTEAVKPELINFSPNVTYNLNIFNSDDAKLLTKINNEQKNKNTTYAADNMAYMYLNFLECKNYDVVNSIYSSYTLTDNRDFYYSRVDFYNSKMHQQINGISDVTLDDFINLFNTYLQAGISVDLLILDKTTDYYNHLDLSKYNVYNLGKLAYVYKTN